MSIASTLPSFPAFAPPSQRLLTAADLALLPTSLSTGDVRYELDNGRLVIMPPPGDMHGDFSHRMSVQFHLEGELRGLGKARGEVGIVLRRNPDRVVGADAAFILKASLPVRRSPEGYLETIPEIVVEVKSKNESAMELTAKAAEYFDAGVKEVWILDPMARSLAVHGADGSVWVCREPEILRSPLLPGFALPLERLFDDS